MRIAFPLARDTRGAVTLELGLLAPIVGMLMIGMMEMSQALSAKSTLEQAVQRGIEMVQQGRAGSNQLAMVRADVASAAGVNQTQVTVSALVDCVGGTAKRQAVTYACPAGTTRVRYIWIHAWKAYQPVFGMHFGTNRETDGSYRLTSASSVRIQ